MRRLIKNIALLAVATMGVVSCTETNIEENINIEGKKLVLRATIPGDEPTTKVEFEDNGSEGISLSWEEGDKFTLYDSTGKKVDIFTNSGGDEFTSSIDGLTLTEDEVYTAKYNEDADPYTQDGDAIASLDEACQMEATFTAGVDDRIAFKHKMAIVTFQFKSDKRPAKLVFENGDLATYTVNYTNIDADTEGFYTSHIMINPCDAVERTLIFTLYDSEGVDYDTRTVNTSMAYVIGKRYPADISTLELIQWQDFAAETFADNTPYSDSVNDYTITTAEELALLAKLVNSGTAMSGKTFTLANDINLSGKEWNAIGLDFSNSFKGTFDGAGFAIEGLYINNPDSKHQALIGYANDVTIKNLSVSGSVVSGSRSGGIVGTMSNNSLIINCHNEVSVKGTIEIGGIVGYLYESSVVNCYNTASVKGTNKTGGIVGYSYRSTISNCYNTASVEGGSYTGAIVGQTDISTTTDCYWNTSVADMPEVAIGSNSGDCSNLAGMTATEMQDPRFATTLTNNAFLYKNKNTCGWKAVDGGLPILDYNSKATYTYSFEGEGTESSPYKISTAEDLRTLSTVVNNDIDTYEGKYLVMTQDIDLGGIDDDGNVIDDKKFNPIGYYYQHCFKGTFDGAGYAVKGLYINDHNDYAGLFGAIDGATIKNISVAGSVYGNVQTGGVVGYNYYSSISNCYNTAAVNGASNVGGVVGTSFGSTISNCYNTAAVNGTSNVGGVAGHSSSSISNCYNTAAVNGTSNVGGIVGSTNESTISNCYNTASVKGSSNVGGVAGLSSSTSSVASCYWDTSATDAPEVGIGFNDGTTVNAVGMTTAEMQTPFFTTLLNNGAYYYNNPDKGDKPKVEACAWSEVADGTPILDFNSKPSAKNMWYNEATGVYEIYTAEGLKEFAEKISDGENTINIKLMCDIDLNGSASNPWTPIGYGGEKFYGYAGIFDGANHTISGLYVDTTTQSAALFGGIWGATIKNLTINGELNSSGSYAAGFAGFVGYDGARFEYCTNNAKICGAGHVGGIVGRCFEQRQAILVGCVNTGAINAVDKYYYESYAGGIIGNIYAGEGCQSQIISCANLGDVTANYKSVGGLTGGSNGGGVIRNSYNRGTVSCTNSKAYVGGLVGYVGYSDSGEKDTVDNCYNSGEVSGDGYIGVVVGYSLYANVSSCYYDKTKGEPIGYSYDDSEIVVPYTSLSTLVTDLNSYATEQGLDGWVAGDDGYPMLEFEK